MNGFHAAGVNVWRGGVRILTDISLACRAGQCVAVIGENGSGKSTLLRALARFEPSASGRMTIDGGVFGLDEPIGTARLSPDLTIVLQNLAIWPHLSVEENIMLPWRTRAAEARLTEPELRQLMQVLEIDDLRSRRPNAISGGQRQRVALARAFALTPKVLLLDEPSAALDARHSKILADLIVQTKARGTSVACVTHNLGFAARIADTFCFVRAGRKEAAGLWNEIRETSLADLNDFLSLHSLQ